MEKEQTCLLCRKRAKGFSKLYRPAGSPALHGQAIRGSGDLEGVSPQVTLGEMNRPVKVIIDHIVP